MKKFTYTICFLILLLFYCSENPTSSNKLEKQKVVFTSDRDGLRQIYIMDIDGKNQKRLFEAEYPCFNPKFSKNGEKILFTSSSDINTTIWEDIHIINVDGTNHINLTSSPNISDDEPSFSPDGNSFVFRSSMDTGNYEIYSYNLISNEITRLTYSDQNKISNYYDPKFTTDGSKIYFIGYYPGTIYLDQWEIFIMDYNGLNLKNLTNNEYGDTSPFLSKNDSLFVYVYGSVYGDIVTMKADGSMKKTISQQINMYKYNPIISPDLKYVIYSMGDLFVKIHKMDINGENDINLTSDIISDFHTITPDGLNILYENGDDIYKMNIDGSNKINLTNGLGKNQRPNVQPILP